MRVRLTAGLISCLLMLVALTLPPTTVDSARRGGYIYSNSALGLLRVCRDGMNLIVADQFLDVPRERLLAGTLLRTGELLFEDVFVMEPVLDPEPGDFALAAEVVVSWPLIRPGDRVAVATRVGGTPLAIGIVANCRLADAGGWAHDPEFPFDASIGTLPDARPEGLGAARPQLLYLMAQESPLNAGYIALLTELGLVAEALTLAEAAALTPQVLDTFDQIVVADDTGALTAGGPVWLGSIALRDALSASAAPLLGIGAGGYSLLKSLRVPLAGQTLPVVTTTQVMTATQTGSFSVAPVWPLGVRPGAVSLYSEPPAVVPGVNASRSSLHPLVSLASAGLLPPLAVAGDRIVTAGARCYSLWGFRAPAATLTGLGKSLFARVAAETACGGRAFGPFTADSALSFTDPITIGGLAVTVCIEHPAGSRVAVELLAPDGRLVTLISPQAAVNGGFGLAPYGCEADDFLHLPYYNGTAFSNATELAFPAGEALDDRQAYLASGPGSLADLLGAEGAGVWVLRARDLQPGPTDNTNLSSRWTIELHEFAPSRVFLPALKADG